MFRNYFKTSVRNLLKNRQFALINISGLAIGMAVTMLIGLWIWDELSFNSYHSNHDEIAQIARKEITNGETYIAANNNQFPIPLANELRTSYAGFFKNVALVSANDEHVISFGENMLTRKGMFAEAGFGKIFTLKMVSGSANGLNDVRSILLSQSNARSLFGNEDPVGKMLKMDKVFSLKVAGVYEDMPDNTEFSDVSFLCPWNLLVRVNGFVKSNQDNWANSSYRVYVQTNGATSMEKISKSIQDVYYSKIKGTQSAAGYKADLFLHPMKDWHLRSEWTNGIQSGGRIRMVWMFGIIGGFVLLLACINFINLSTARSAKRAKEVGIRKAIGSLRHQLVKQFMGESLLLVCIAFAISLAMVYMNMAWFNTLADKKIILPFAQPVFWFLAFAFILFTSFISGSYPAFYLSAMQPVKVLKGKIQSGRVALFSRRALVGLQFTVSISLIIATTVVYFQVQFAKNRAAGYEKNGLLQVVMNTPDFNGKYEVLKKELIETGGAISFAQSTTPATDVNTYDDRFEWEGKNPNDPSKSFTIAAVTVDFGKTIGWQVAQGRDFSEKFPTDRAGVILNEAAVKHMNLTDPVGKTIKWNGNPYSVIGVIKNMVAASPYKPVQQSVFFLFPEVGPFMSVRLNPALSTGEAIERITPVFRKHNPSAPFEYRFADEEYGRKFAAEKQVGQLAGFFAALAIFISCLGIFGLASFVAEQRTREIGVRKVLGAGILTLWSLLSKEFVWLVLIAFIIAAPLAWYFMNEWLQQYEYRTQITWWMFGAAGVAALLITLITVSYQAIKAALMSPVKALKSE
jgi:putative ABC transport system permease protein